MKTLILLAIVGLAVCTGGCSLLGERELPPGRAVVRLLGRWDASGAPARVVTVNPGSSFQFRYRGAACRLHFDRSANKPPLPQLWACFDGTWTRHVLDHDVLELGRGAAAGRHEVWVVLKSADEHQPRWTPPLVASLTLTDIDVGEGRFLEPPRRRKLVLEAIGDSITEGILVHPRAKGKAWTDFADSRKTYAFLTAEALGAEPRIIGFGAQGVTRGGNGGVPPVGLAYPFAHAGVRPDEAPAGVVVINHGCNDDWKLPSIEAGYRNLIRLGRARNPEAHIFCLVPFAQPPHRLSIARAVDAARADGDPRVYFVETEGWIDKKADTTDGVHPSAQGHAKAAEHLTAFIRRTLKLRGK